MKQSIDELKVLKDSNSTAVKRLAKEIRNDIGNFQMETRNEAKLLIAYLENIIEEIKTEFTLNE